MKEFVSIKEYGQLYIDKVIFESYYPIIFTCKNNKKDIFICVCYQNNSSGVGWLVGKVMPCQILRFLKDEISLKELLVKYSDDKYVVSFNDNSYNIKYEQNGWEDTECLPKEDSYLYADVGEFDEEIEYFSNMDLSMYSAMDYHNIVSCINELNQCVDSISNSIPVITEMLEKVSFSAEIMKTLKVINELGTNFSASISFEYDKEVTEKNFYTASFDTANVVYSTELKESDVIKIADAA